VAGRFLLERVHRVLRAADHVVFDASRVGRAGEIAGWSNAASAFAVALGTAASLWSRFATNAAWLGLVAGAATLLLLRLALAHRYTVWISAAIGTLTIASLGASAAWLLGHVVETPSAPSAAAVLGAVIASLAPAWAYAQLAKRRADRERDSLIDPVSVPGSR
jgi:hypothetical protein